MLWGFKNAQALQTGQLGNTGWVGATREAVTIHPGEDGLVTFASAPSPDPPVPEIPRRERGGQVSGRIPPPCDVQLGAATAPQKRWEMTGDEQERILITETSLF